MREDKFTDNGEGRMEKRVNFLGIAFILVFLVYGARLFALQILGGEAYRARAQSIALRTSVLPAQRGEIYDRSFTTPLAMNESAFAVTITPGEIPRSEVPKVIARTASILGVPRDQLEKKIPPQSYYMYQPIEAASNVPYSVIASLAEHADALPGVAWYTKPARRYQNLGSLSHIMGYVGDITKDELTMLYNKGYQQGDIIGKNGIEKQYDELLRGKEGSETRVVDVRGRRIAGGATERVPPRMGNNLVLTIDKDIQTLTEKALGPRIGAAVVLRPSSGEILAMVSYPWYDSNIFFQPSGSGYQALLSDPRNPLINRAIQSHYAPASTFKIVMTTGILSENSFPPEKYVDCQGEMNYGERLWRCHIRKPGHGRLNLQQAMAQSCDIYYWNVGRDYLGVERIVSYAQDYGFGSLTDIDLPGEIPGIVPTPQWKERRIHEKWLGGDTMNMSIGQGYTLVTPLQMADMTAMAVNNGVIYTPHLLKEVRDPVTGEVTETYKRKVLHESDVPRQVFETVKRDMRGVITSGTVQYTPLNNLFTTRQKAEIAGKTGTGEVGAGVTDRWNSWFTAYAPYQTNNPEERVVVAVIVEAANTWEWWATYASAIIFQGIFAHETYEEAVDSLGMRWMMNNAPLGRRE